ncbi:Protein kinase domain containing protein [Entamoeba marina]
MQPILPYTIRDFHFFEEKGPCFMKLDNYNIFFYRPRTLLKQECLLICCDVTGYEILRLGELRSILLSLDLKQMNGILKIDDVVFGNYRENSFRSIIAEFWIVCEPIRTVPFRYYFEKQKPGVDEIKFMIYDLLFILKDISRSPHPCIISEDTVVFKRDPASPFLRLRLSPLAFLFGFLYPSREENYNHFLRLLIRLINELEPCESTTEIIRYLESGSLIDHIFNTEFIQKLIALVEGPMYNGERYEQLGTIGEGKYGTVMKCLNCNGKTVAIKASCGENMDILKREAIIMRLCDHPNIVKFISFKKEERRNLPFQLINFPHAFLVMEYCGGVNLDKYVDDHSIDDRWKKRGILPIDLIDDIFYQMTEALKYLYDKKKKIIHRDIKLENFLLVNDGPCPTVKLCDFGFGRAIYDEMETYVGTPLFAAPEIFKNIPYSPKSDLYSLGICLYCLTTSEYPFGVRDYNSFYRLMCEQELVVQFSDFFQNSPFYGDIIDLIEQLTRHNEEKRMTWKEFKDHSYMKKLAETHSSHN